MDIDGIVNQATAGVANHKRIPNARCAALICAPDGAANNSIVINMLNFDRPTFAAWLPACGSFAWCRSAKAGIRKTADNQITLQHTKKQFTIQC